MPVDFSRRAEEESAYLDERRKNAYRSLLYYAMLEIRRIAWLEYGNPLHWKRNLLAVRRAGAVAGWLHNLA